MSPGWLGWWGNIGEFVGDANTQIFNTYVYMFLLYIQPPHPPIMEAAFGRLHKSGQAAFGRPSTFVESIMGRWGGWIYSKHIWKYVLNICVLPSPTNSHIFPYHPNHRSLIVKPGNWNCPLWTNPSYFYLTGLRISLIEIAPWRCWNTQICI